MKTVLILALLVFCGTAHGENDTDLVYNFVNCALRAASDGIDGFIPPHNPLYIRDIIFDQTVLDVEYHYEVTNNILYNLMDLELKQVDVTSYTNPGALNIDYDIYWKVLNFTSDFAWYAKASEAETGGNGTINIILHHTDFTGLFNLTKPGQVGIKTHLDDFTLNVSVKDVEAHIQGAGPEYIVDKVVQFTLYTALNNVPSVMADLLKARFNDFWIAHPDRIDQVTQWCYDNPKI